MADPAADEAERARRQLMTGMMLVMGACVLGGLSAVVLMMLGQRTAAMGVAVVAVLAIVSGIVLQLRGYRRLKSASNGANR